MIIDFNQEGFLFDTFDSEGTPNAAQGNGGAPAQVKDIREEKLFRDYICKEPPANWEQFFKDIKSRCNPLNITKKKYIVMEIPTNNKDLQRIILSDPIISKYSVKAEGYLLLVEVSNRIKVAAALKKYGYLL